jgi:hypothetical protein
LPHPEDTILTGDLNALSALYAPFSDFSVKFDGAPAVVWGTNPETGNFFVGTKSVFNKKKIKINETHSDIEVNHGHQKTVANILHHCLDYLPRTSSIVQGDFIGFGGEYECKPNTIIYQFDELVEQKIIIAPHTVYDTNGSLSSAYIIEDDDIEFNTTDTVLFVIPCVDRMPNKELVPNIDIDAITFLSDKESKKAQIEINSLIREGIDLNDRDISDIVGCSNLANLYLMIKEMKELLMESLIVNGGPRAFIDDGDFEVDGEGYVMKTKNYGTYKLVDREVFSYANFTQSRFA